MVLTAPLIQSQISTASKAAYREYLIKVEQMYSKLLVRKKKTLYMLLKGNNCGSERVSKIFFFFKKLHFYFV